MIRLKDTIRPSRPTPSWPRLRKSSSRAIKELDTSRQMRMVFPRTPKTSWICTCRWTRATWSWILEHLCWLKTHLATFTSTQSTVVTRWAQSSACEDSLILSSSTGVYLRDSQVCTSRPFHPRRRTRRAVTSLRKEGISLTYSLKSAAVYHTWWLESRCRHSLDQSVALMRLLRSCWGTSPLHFCRPTDLRWRFRR